MTTDNLKPNLPGKANQEEEQIKDVAFLFKNSPFLGVSAAEKWPLSICILIHGPS
jgi:hypothetical protein